LRRRRPCSARTSRCGCGEVGLKLVEDRGREGFGWVDDVDDVNFALALCNRYNATAFQHIFSTSNSISQS
jgi:hypothetical protein